MFYIHSLCSIVVKFKKFSLTLKNTGPYLVKEGIPDSKEPTPKFQKVHKCFFIMLVFALGPNCVYGRLSFKQFPELNPNTACASIPDVGYCAHHKSAMKAAYQPEILVCKCAK